MTGLIIVLEGLNGIGKSTVAAGLKDFFEARSKQCIILRDPGTSPVGERIRAIVKDPELHPQPYTTLFLYQAAKLEMLPEIKRYYQAGYVLILDRWWHSTYAYQGAMGIDSRIILNQVKQFELDFPHMRHISIIMTADRPGNAVKMIAEAKKVAIAANEKPDRWEESSEAFLNQVDKRYRDLYNYADILGVATEKGRVPLVHILYTIRLMLIDRFDSQADLMEILS